MGTRNLTMVLADNEIKVAQYGQWDGYLSGQGVTVAEFIHKNDMDKFKDMVKKVKFLTEEDKEVDGPILPEYSRDTGAKILDLVNKGMVTALVNGSSFAGDSLFCEFAYLLDLDSKNLEIYYGFNKSPLTENDRFYTTTREKEDSDYHQIRLKHTIPFSEVSKKTVLELEKMESKED